MNLDCVKCSVRTITVEISLSYFEELLMNRECVECKVRRSTEGDEQRYFVTTVCSSMILLYHMVLALYLSR